MSGLIRDPNPASGFQVASELVKPAFREQPSSKKDTQEARLYASGQEGLLSSSSQVPLKTIPTGIKIEDVDTYPIDNVLEWMKNVKTYENSFFRTRTGGQGHVGFRAKVDDKQFVLLDLVRKGNRKHSVAFLRAGPRAEIVFYPTEVKAAIVTCGGLCPGLNDVVHELTQVLHYNYSVDTIYGIRNGYRGFYDPQYMPYKVLNPKTIEGVHQRGGTLLGSSRGGFDRKRIIDACIKSGINQIYVIGGDGTHRGARELADEAKVRGLKMTVVGIPKTIDNDIALIDKSFGFDTAVEQAVKAIDSARIEAECVPNGIGIVKLMGRHAGFISAHATLADRNVDLCLIPEIPIQLEGPNGILHHIENTLEFRGRCVIVVAEGAGEELMVSEMKGVDESGNKKLPPIGDYLKKVITDYFQKKKIAVNIKYNDPSYMIRSVPANAADSVYCMILAQNAVHGAMAGYTGFTSGLVNNRTVLIPMELITKLSPTHLSP